MGLETGWNCHISLTPNGDMPGSEIPPSSPSHAGSLHDDLNQGEDKSLLVSGMEQVERVPCREVHCAETCIDPSCKHTRSGNSPTSLWAVTVGC